MVKTPPTPQPHYWKLPIVLRLVSNATHMNKFWKLSVYMLVVRCLLGSSAVLLAQSNADADRLIEEAMKTSPIEQNLRHLTDEIGGRVPGTPAMDRAVAWGVAAFKDAGADSVHTESFKMPVSWAEGNRGECLFGGHGK